MTKEELLTKIAMLSPNDGRHTFHSGFNYAKREMSELVKNQFHEETIRVPLCAIPWLTLHSEYDSKYLYKLCFSMALAIDHNELVPEHWPWSKEFFSWLMSDFQNLTILAKAQQYGYLVTPDEPREKYYEVVFFQSKRDRILLMQLDEDTFEPAYESEAGDYRGSIFTEEVIRGVDPELMSIAKEVLPSKLIA